LVRLKPRISIKPAEPERAGEAVSVPGLPSVLPPVGPVPVGSPEKTGEKVKIDLGPLIKPSASGSSAGAVSPATPMAGEKTEVVFKFKLKPASGGDLPESPALASLAGVKPPEVTSVRPAMASPAIPGVPIAKVAPAVVPTAQANEVSATPQPGRHTSLTVLVGLLVISGVCFFGFFVRAPKPVAVVHPPSAGMRPPPPAVRPVVPSASSAVAVSDSSENATPGAPAVPPTETPGALSPASSSAPAAIQPPLPPPPPEPSPQFRAFVEHLKINGVRTGPPARLFVDGVACRPGDVLDRDMGVVFDGVDAATSEVLFKDATGAVVRRRY
jgi:hypothetical protein